MKERPTLDEILTYTLWMNYGHPQRVHSLWWFFTGAIVLSQQDLAVL